MRSRWCVLLVDTCPTNLSFVHSGSEKGDVESSRQRKDKNGEKHSSRRSTSIHSSPALRLSDGWETVPDSRLPAGRRSLHSSVKRSHVHGGRCEILPGRISASLRPHSLSRNHIQGFEARKVSFSLALNVTSFIVTPVSVTVPFSSGC